MFEIIHTFMKWTFLHSVILNVSEIPRELISTSVSLFPNYLFYALSSTCSDLSSHLMLSNTQVQKKNYQQIISCLIQWNVNNLARSKYGRKQFNIITYFFTLHAREAQSYFFTFNLLFNTWNCKWNSKNALFKNNYNWSLRNVQVHDTFQCIYFS